MAAPVDRIPVVSVVWFHKVASIDSRAAPLVWTDFSSGYVDLAERGRLRRRRQNAPVRVL